MTSIFKRLVKCLEKSKRIIIVSPYLSRFALSQILSSCNQLLSVEIYTLFYPELFLQNSSDLSALEYCIKMGFDVFAVERLHAKIYCGDFLCMTGSANCTVSGLGIRGSENSNIEYICDQDQNDPFLQKVLNQIKDRSLTLTSEDIAKMGRVIEESQVKGYRFEWRKILHGCWIPASGDIYDYFLVSGGSLSGLTTSDSIVIQRDLNYLGIKNHFGSKTNFANQLLKSCKQEQLFVSLLKESSGALKSPQDIEEMILGIPTSESRKIFNWIKFFSEYQGKN